LPLIVCDVICGKWEQAGPATAALHLLKTAAETFDDIEDADSSNSVVARYGTALAINVATTLIMLAEKAVLRLQTRGVEDRTIIRILDSINSFYTTACLGQHMDHSIKPRLSGIQPIDEEKYLHIIHLKSAFHLECACQVGALLALSDREQACSEQVDKYTKFGYYLGMASQIANDIQGVTGGIDLKRKKLTLPVIFALSHGNNAVRKHLQRVFSQPSDQIDHPDDLIRELYDCGAVFYSTVKMTTYKQQALDLLTGLTNMQPKEHLLKLFLE
jgi:geranylgeranyl pyrophosphate synthase